MNSKFSMVLTARWFVICIKVEKKNYQIESLLRLSSDMMIKPLNTANKWNDASEIQSQ